jgi:copper resistance protein D
MDDPLIWIRAIHFASTVMAAGLVVFVLVVAEPALRSAGAPFPPSYLRHAARGLYVSLVVVGLTGLAWFLLLATRIADESTVEALSDGAAWALLTDTQFGWACLMRLVFAGALAITFATRRVFAIACAALLLGGLDWMGHGAATPGDAGYVHLGADFLHLIAAGAWIGGLLPLLTLLRGLRHSADDRSTAAIHRVSRHFSDFALTAVIVLVATGLINAWFLVGALKALTDTDYGRLLTTKIAIFIAMLVFAGINRVLLLPRLSGVHSVAFQLVRYRELQLSIAVEICLGGAVIVIVAVLGVMMPAAPFSLHQH